MLSMIVAKGQNNEIGVNNGLPWRLRTDLVRFRDITMNADGMIMGHNTYRSLPDEARPLRGRTSLVLCNNSLLVSGTTEQHPDKNATVIWNPDIDRIVDIAKKNKDVEIIVIGGASVYKQFIDKVDRIYMTHVHGEFPEADAFFPELDMRKWDSVGSEDIPADHDNDYPTTVEIIERRKLKYTKKQKGILPKGAVKIPLK